MSSAPPLDDLERDIARTLRTKADQLVVDAGPFPHAAVGHVESSRVTVASSPRRRLLAVAAVMVLLAGGSAVLRGWASGTAGRDTTDATGASEAWLDETVAFAPPGDGWEMEDIVLAKPTDPTRTTWQLFGEDQDQPAARGVLVGTVDGGWAGPSDDWQHMIHGHRGTIARPADLPSGTFEAVWDVGGVWHRAFALGDTDAEALALVESLVPRDDATEGFDRPTDGSLEEIDTATTVADAGTDATFVGPDRVVTVTTRSQDPYGGLLHRLAGTRTPGGTILASDAGDGPDGSQQAIHLGEDGWSVTVVESGSEAADLSTKDVSRLARRMRPVPREEVIEWATEPPVTAAFAAGEWTVRVHGTNESDTGVCVVAPSGDEGCATAEQSYDHTTASLPLGGDWVVLAITNWPDRPHTRDPMGSSGSMGDFLEGDAGRSGDRLIEVVTVPDTIQAVEAGTLRPGERYERPAT